MDTQTFYNLINQVVTDKQLSCNLEADYYYYGEGLERKQCPMVRQSISTNVDENSILVLATEYVVDDGYYVTTTVKSANCCLLVVNYSYSDLVTFKEDLVDIVNDFILLSINLNSLDDVVDKLHSESVIIRK